LENEAADPSFWSDSVRAQQKMQELSTLQEELRKAKKVAEILDEAEVNLQLAQEEEEEDTDLIAEAAALLEEAAKEINAMELALLFNGRYDHADAIIALHPGAGGLESQDWTEMLFRMYTRWAERKGYAVEILDLLPGEEAGIKSVTLSIKGERAYGYLKAERGVHRLVRLSPFDTAHRRHTSFASVDVLPQCEEHKEFEVKPDELRIDTYRASGAGGQHVNTTDSAVRITHLPTGIVVQCQQERSQHSNREKAMRILYARLADHYQRKQEEELNALRGEQKEIAWGSQIRSYVFHPYTLVKDHRTNVEVGNIQAVMDGEIDVFLETFLLQQSKGDTR
jgi:peptide chain release factor 2